ncbi:MAG: CRISPR-associated primase-polymerase type A1 [Thermodesulfobacteriota bacterium]
MNAIHPPEVKQALPDFSLLIAGLEKQILSGTDPDRYLQVLNNERLYEKLEVEQQIKWANLAQMAGEMDAACRVLDHINRNFPQCVEGWRGHLELLRILDRKKEIARVLARSREFVADNLYQEWQQAFGASDAVRVTDEFQNAALPFENLRNRRQALECYLDLFSGREDCFARQWVDRQANKQGYIPVRRPMTHQDLEEHLKGLKTYGIYLLKSDGSVKTAVIDIDLQKDYQGRKLSADKAHLIKRELSYVIHRTTELAAASELRPLVEFSGGKGYHFWFFFDKPAAPAVVRAVLDGIKKSVAGDLSAFSIEVFPKQDRLKGKGYGNLVKLPLGVHRLTGKRSYFLQCHGRAIDAQLDFLSKAPITASEKLAAIQHNEKAQTILLHPKLEKWAEAYPELYDLERKCPPLGQIIAVCRNEKGLSIREEKVLLQTVGFLPRAKTLLHHLLAPLPDYNPHLVDYRLSRIRGTPLGCRRIHSLLNFVGDFCRMDVSADYQHPLMLLDESFRGGGKKYEKADNLADALVNLKAAITQMERFIR